MTKRMSNIPLKDFRKFLFNYGLKRDHINGGHEIWVKEGCSRPIVIQTHVDPVPIFIVKNILQELKVSKKDFLEMIGE